MTRTRQLTTLILIAGALLLVAAGTAHAKPTAEQKCQKGRYDAAAKYAACQQKALGKLYGGGEYEKWPKAIGKCTTRYTATWVKLQKKALGSGATCDRYRFQNNGDGTVTDWLTGLQWEETTDDGGINDKDNSYVWSTSGDGDASDEDGSAFTTFLATLNAAPCFAGQCGWRLPTVAELQTILAAPSPCTTSPCVDQAVFGPTRAGIYWSATSATLGPAYAWTVNFLEGSVSSRGKTSPSFVRAVRAGL